MKNKIFAGILALLTLVSLFSCGKEAEAKRYDYDLAEYVELGEIDPVKAKFADPTVCTEEEIDHAVFQVMLGYASFTEKSEGAVELYDRVCSTYQILYEGEPLDEYSQNEYYLITGYEAGGDIDWYLGQEMVGKNIGDTVSIDYTFPETDATLGVWAGKTVQAQATILRIYDATSPECTDEFVKTIGDFGFGTVLDFRVQLKNDILDQKEADKRDAVQKAFLDGVKVKKYPEAEMQAYVDRFVEEIRLGAEELGITYEEYIAQYLEMTDDEVSQAAKKDAEERVKKDLACIQASRLLKTKLSKKEYKEGLQRYFENAGSEFETVEEFEEYYTKDFMWESILWDKTFETMVEKAVSTLE